jgi:hypothetical protein
MCNVLSGHGDAMKSMLQEVDLDSIEDVENPIEDHSKPKINRNVEIYDFENEPLAFITDMNYNG